MLELVARPIGTLCLDKCSISLAAPKKNNPMQPQKKKSSQTIRTYSPCTMNKLIMNVLFNTLKEHIFTIQITKQMLNYYTWRLVLYSHYVI